MPSHFIHNVWHEGTGPQFQSLDPATNQPLASYHAAAPAEVDQAVRAARGAFEHWSLLPIEERIDYLNAFAERLKQDKSAGQTLPLLISQETGKPFWESLTELDAMINKIPISIQALKDRRSPIEQTANGQTTATRYKPHGVIAVFGPFNFPAHLPNGHIVPALLAGNTVVFKPSELTPGVARRTVEIWHEAGLPAGVLNLVQGARETGQSLASHPDIDGLFFTGSVAAGRALNKMLADQPHKILALEMGGNNPLIVWNAANLDAAALLTIQSAYQTTGQRCSCARRLIIEQGPRGDALVSRLLELILRIQIGPHTDRPEPFMGPLVRAHAAENALAAQQRLIEQGAVPLQSMSRPSSIHPPSAPDAFLTPGLLDVTSITPPDEEIFAPLLQVIRVPNFEAALTAANHTAFGLCAALISDDSALYRRVLFTRIRAGVVNFNRPTTGALLRVSFRRCRTLRKQPPQRLSRRRLLLLPHRLHGAARGHSSHQTSPGFNAHLSQSLVHQLNRARNNRDKTPMLLPSQVIPFLSSDDAMLRAQAIRYFTGASDMTPLTADQVWEAIRSVGLPEADGGLIQLLQHVHQSDTSTEALLAALALPPDEANREWLIETLEELAFAQLRRHADVIFARTDLPADTISHLRARLELADALAAGPLWTQLDRFIQRNQELDWEDTDYSERGRVLEALARFDQDSTDRAIALIRRNDENQYQHLIFAIDLLARMRHRPSLDLLLRALAECSEEDDGLIETLHDAIPAIGGTDAIAKLEILMPRLPWGKRIETAYMLGQIKHPDAEAALLRLLHDPQLADARDSVVQALFALCTTDGLPRLRPQIVLEGNYDADLYDFSRDLVAAALMAGPEHDFPELATLREEAIARDIETARRIAAMDFDPSNLDDDLTKDDFLDDPDPPSNLSDRTPRHTAPIRRDPTTPGRNDPCPCGSGKKYKKCCLNKQT